MYGTIELQNTIQRMEGITVNVDEELCVGCGECMNICVFKGMEIQDGIAQVNQNKCLGCGRCERVCLNGAISINLDDPKRIEELISRIEASVDVS
jgi:heterodisulfide reductase subunit A-like polyferredoxin